MKLLKMTAIMLLIGGGVFAQTHVSPVISMTWDWDNSTYDVGQRIGAQATIDGGRYYGIDTDGSDHRTFFGWKAAKLGIGIRDDGTGLANEMYFTIGASYNVVGGLRSEIDYITDESADSNIRISLTATF